MGEKWAREALASADEIFTHKGNAIYLFELPKAPRDQPTPTALLHAVESLFAQENVLVKSYVHTTTKETSLAWLIAIAEAGSPPWGEELELGKVKVTKVRDGVVPEMPKDDGYETDHEAGAQAAADAGPAFNMD